MNIVLFFPEEMGVPLPASDLRVQHVKRILRIGPGEAFEAGLINQKRGRAWIAEEDGGTVVFEGAFDTDPDPCKPVELVLGFVRPLCAKRILKDMTALGVRAVHLVATELGEKSYREADLWKDGAYTAHLIEGAEQGFSTLLPEVSLHWSLKALESFLSDRFAGKVPVRIAFDNGEDALPLDLPEREASSGSPVLVAVGSERGWSVSERAYLRSSGYRLTRMGYRVLRTEAACSVGMGIVFSRYGLF
jgi:16S rRNA (uracil1498-N3)-methyltransferase